MGDKKTRRRGAALEEAILRAAWEELAEGGWTAFTIAGVAKRCGTAKPVIYRRWSNRAELVHDMLDRAVRAEAHAGSSSGDLRTDLLSFLQAMVVFLDGPFGEAVRGVLLEGTNNGHSALFGPDVPSGVIGAVDAAVERGELGVRPCDVALNAGHALVTHELLHVGSPPDDGRVRQIVDCVWLPALRAGGS